MAIVKLDLPWRMEPLPIDDSCIDEVIDDLKASSSPHIQVEGDDVLVKDFFGVNNRVLDVSRYHIDDDGIPVCHRDIPESNLQLQPQFRSIVLLLESPSVGEYQCRNIALPLAPANGKTGNNICRCLGMVLSHVEEQQLIIPNCPIIISNPIQFQANLQSIHGSSTWNGDNKWRKLKDCVWKALWKDDEDEGKLGYIQLCFRSRLRTYRPSLVINACTGEKGCRRDDPKGLVAGFVRTELPDAILYETPHPASWTSHACKITVSKVDLAVDGGHCRA